MIDPRHPRLALGGEAGEDQADGCAQVGAASHRLRKENVHRGVSQKPVGRREQFVEAAAESPARDLRGGQAVANTDSVSSFAGAPLPADAVYFGEVSLSGTVRPVAQAAARLKEAQKLGFTRAVVPEGRTEAGGEDALSLRYVSSLAILVAEIADDRTKPDARSRTQAAGRKERAADL